MPDTQAEDLDSLAGRALAELLPLCRTSGHPLWLIYQPQPDGTTRREVIRSEGLAPHLVEVPDACVAVGVVAMGKVTPLDPASELAADLLRAASGGLGLAYVVDRHGHDGWSSTVPGSGGLPAPEGGAMVDSLRRMMGLATVPPPCPVEYVDAVGWLSRIWGVGVATGARLDWSDVVALAPGFEATGWEQLRLATAAGSGRSPVDVPPDLAAWMDEGMFARYMVGRLPELRAAWEACRPHLMPAAARRLCPLAHLAGARQGAVDLWVHK